MRNFFSGPAAVALAAVLWSTGGVFIKSIHADPLLIAAVRTGIAGLVLAPFIRPKELKINIWMLLLVLSYGALAAFVVMGTRWTSAANALALQFTAPLWIFIAHVVIYRKIAYENLLPVVLIALGLGAILLEPASGTSALGNLIGAGSGILFACTTVLFKKVGENNVIGSVSICNLLAAPFIFIFVPPGIGLAEIHVSDWMMLAYLGVFEMGAAYTLYSLGLRTTSAQNATMIALLEPVLNPIWVFIFIGEIPTPYGMVGGTLILLGLISKIVLDVNQKNKPSEIAGK
ncbi:DMT family transporter [Candidatus Formimonas warabiya]|uniref:EamA domain-containing protein n=1 Tax=Formimonas warabiya TaxID=1761012 RepID=A0A3G1KPF5_FORW1|nr:DMT family transporter [Candidatus Formimonas warabiya]ATW24310.1 hypothetical protein DCMF_05460 [Candidatus Formimonas warabiya]